MTAEDTGRLPEMDATADSQLLAGATATSGHAPAATTQGGADKGVWADLDKQGSGLKQKLRDMKRQVDTEVLSARRDLTMKKSATKQKNEDMRLQSQIMQLNQENVGMAQSLLALDRRLKHIEEDLHGVGTALDVAAATAAR